MILENVNNNVGELVGLKKPSRCANISNSLLRLERLQGHLRFLLHSTVSMKLLLPVEVKTAQREKELNESKSNPVDGTSKQRPTEVPHISRCKVANGGYREKIKPLIGSSSTSQNTQNVAFVSNSTNNTNNTHEADDSSHEISTTQSTTHTQHNSSNIVCLDNLCDAVICAFLVSQPNCPQLSQEDLEQLHPDDLEEMDLQWEMVMLTIRARRFIKRTGKKLNINGQRVGFDKFPRNQEFKGRENNTRTIAVETPTQNALIAQDGIGGYDWSYQVEEEQLTNHAFMAFTSSRSSSSSESEVDSCSKTCVKAYASLKEQYDNFSSDYKKSQFNLVSYKAGLESVEARLVRYKKNKTVLEASINVLKLEVRLRDNALDVYKLNLEKAEAEGDQLKQTLESFKIHPTSPAVEAFVNLIDKSGLDKAYHAVPPPLTGNFIPRKPDLTFIDEIVESENLDVTTVVTPSNVKTVADRDISNTVESNAVRMDNTSAPIIEDWNSDDESEIDYTIVPSIEKTKSVKTVRETDAAKQNPRGNQRNWNNLMSQRLGNDFKMTNKACYTCGSFEHLHYVCDKKVARPAWNNSRRVNHKNFSNKMSHPHPKRSFVPKAVLTRSGKLNIANTNAVNTARPVNTAASKQTVNHPRPINNTFKRGYSQSSRPFNRYFANKNSISKTNVNTVSVKHTTARDRAVVRNKGKGANAVKASACWVWKAKNSSASTTFKKFSYIDARGRSKSIMAWIPKKNLNLLFYVQENPPQKEYKEKVVIDSGCSRHMTGNKCYLDEYEDYDGGLVSFGDGEGRIFGKVKIKTRTLDFKDVYFCKELKYNLYLMKVPRKDNIYSVELKSVVPIGDLTCLIAKATIDESNTWHRRLGHINFKTLNKLVKANLVKGLPLNIFENDHSCVACQKGKQHKASYKTKLVNSISNPLHMLHMDLFGLTNVKSLMKKSYCVVVTDDFSRFSWVFFLATKDETSGILKTFIIEIENQLDHKVKVIRSDNGTEFKNSIMNQFCEIKGIKRELSVARTPLVLVIKHHNKTPYELIRGRPPLIDFMKPFGCLVTILNTKDHLGKFEGKADEGYFVRYYVVSKDMRVFNKRTRIVEETLNIRFLENLPNVKGNGPDWLFDVDSLSISMNYVPVVVGNKTNGIAGTKDNTIAGQAQKEKEPEQEYILIPICTTDPSISQGPKDRERDTKVDENKASNRSRKDDEPTRSELERLNQREIHNENTNSTNSVNTISTPVSTARPTIDTVVPSPPFNTPRPSVNTANAFEEHLFKRFSPFKNDFSLLPVPNMSSKDNTGIFGNAYDDEDVEEEVDMNNVNSSYTVPDTSFTKFHKDHPEDQVIGSLKPHVQTRHMTKTTEDHCLISSVHQLKRTNHKDVQNCLFACFLSQKEPKKVLQAMEDPSWVEEMQNELLQFKLLNGWSLVHLPRDKWAIGTKWVFRNKKDERGIVVKNKARLVAQGHTQEENHNITFSKLKPKYHYTPQT
ncbi:putative ribonuclease H-like domain-containing protein [Tanacetum coccineum]